MIKKTRILSFLAISLVLPGLAQARISSLSYWSLQDRLATPAGQVDQSGSFQFGLNGVIPSGAEVDGDFFNFPYQITYGVIDKLEVGASLGAAYVDRKNKSAQFGINDLTIAARYRFFEANRAARIPGLDAEIGFAMPTGSFERGMGTGALGFVFNWGLVLPLDPVRAHFGLGYRYTLENSDDTKVGAIFSYNGGVTVPVKSFASDTRFHPFTITGELKGMNHARNKFKGDSTGPSPDELYLAPGFGWEFPKWVTLQYAFLIGLTTDSSDFGMNIELRF